MELTTQQKIDLSMSYLEAGMELAKQAKQELQSDKKQLQRLRGMELKRKDVARILGKSPRTISRLKRKGKITYNALDVLNYNALDAGNYNRR